MVMSPTSTSASPGFGINDLPDLDVCVLNALEMFAATGLPAPLKCEFRRPLVVGSGNAAAAGRILFSERNAVFADESDYKRVLARSTGIDGAILISASGGKHAIEIAAHLFGIGMRAILITHAPDGPARKHVAPNDIYILPRVREPYTYNVSTYLGVVLSGTREEPDSIRAFIDQEIIPRLHQRFEDYDAFFITVPERFRHICQMVLVKFDELFGSRVSARAFTVEEAKHAKTIVSSPKEFFLHLGDGALTFGAPERSLIVPLPADGGYGAAMAIGYYIIGLIQKRHPPYFKDGIEAYCRSASEMFAHRISPIVE